MRDTRDVGRRRSCRRVARILRHDRGARPHAGQGSQKCSSPIHEAASPSALIVSMLLCSLSRNSVSASASGPSRSRPERSGGGLPGRGERAQAAGRARIHEGGHPHTGHEDDKDLGLVNMKGRLYDPIVGRFMSPDPFIQAPFSSQGLNPYSYAFNSPHNWVDPSGFDEDRPGEVPAPENNVISLSDVLIMGELNNTGADTGSSQKTDPGLPLSDPLFDIPSGESMGGPVPYLDLGTSMTPGAFTPRMDPGYDTRSLDFAPSAENEIYGPLDPRSPDFPNASSGYYPNFRADNERIGRAVVPVLPFVGGAYTAFLDPDASRVQRILGGAQLGVDIALPFVGGMLARLGEGAVARAAAEGAGAIQAEFNLTKTVAQHGADVVKRGQFAGQLARPYVNSALTAREIMSAGQPAADKVVAGALRWDVPGSFRGAEGTWELVYDPNTNTILHFLFR